MKYIVTFLVSLLFVAPSFAQGKVALTVSRTLTEDMARKSLSDFTSKYLVTSRALNSQIENALLFGTTGIAPLSTQGADTANRMIGQLSNSILRALSIQRIQIPAEGGYIPSFAKNSKEFAQNTGFEYSDMALMLRHSLAEPTERNFAGYFVKDFRELQRVAINPATGQTLDEALRSAYQQAQKAKSGILVITEEEPEQIFAIRKPLYKGGPKIDNVSTLPAGLKDMYVMDWANGQWVSYKQSTLNPLAQTQGNTFASDGVLAMAENHFGLTITYGKRRVSNDPSIPINTTFIIKNILFVRRSSPWFEQLKYAKERGYYVHVVELPTAGVATDKIDNIRFLFARKKGDPLFNNVFELERGL